MKRTKFAYRPRLESLEHRWVPATVNVIGGNLYISEQVGTLNVSNLVGGQVRVQDSAKDITVSGVGGTSRSAIYITGTAKNDTINFAANVNYTSGAFYGGNLYISGGNGNDIFNLAGTVQSSVTVTGGSGDDVTNIVNDSKVGGFATGGLQVGGNFKVTDSSGDNDLLVEGAYFSVGGTLTASGQHEVHFTNSFVNVQGAITVSSVSSSTGAPLDFVVSSSLLPQPSLLSSGGNITITGYGGNDNVDFSTGLVGVGFVYTDNSFTGASRDITFNLGGGSNSVKVGSALSDGEGGIQDSTLVLSGNLSYIGGSGSDEVYLNYPLIGGNTNVNLGSGTNIYHDHGVRGTSENVSGFIFSNTGDVSVIGGSGSNTLEFGWDFSLGSTPLFNGSTYKIDDLNISLGSGTNSTTFLSGFVSGAPGTYFPVSINSTFTYVGGTGSDTVKIDPLDGGTYHYIGSTSTIALGAGTNTLSYHVQDVRGATTVTGGSGINDVHIDTSNSVSAALKVALGTSASAGVNSLSIVVNNAITSTTSITMGNGTNTTTISTENDLDVISGNGLVYNGGSGTDSVNVNIGDDMYSGNAVFNLGDGTNTLKFFVNDNDIRSSRPTVTVTGGKNTNSLTFSGDLAASFIITLGNGTNTTQFNDAPNGTITYRGGNSNNTVNLSGGTFSVDIIFGNSGTQLLTLAQANTITGRALSGTPATSTFDNNGSKSNFTLNFPEI